jgi:hypothetical protein
LPEFYLDRLGIGLGAFIGAVVSPAVGRRLHRERFAFAADGGRTAKSFEREILYLIR